MKRLYIALVLIATFHNAFSKEKKSVENKDYQFDGMISREGEEDHEEHEEHGLEYRDRFYDDKGDKKEFNIYAKIDYHLTDQLSIYVLVRMG